MTAYSKLAKALPGSETLPPTTGLEKITHEIENLPDQAAAVAMIRATLGDTAIARFQLGGVLVQMKDQGWFCGYTSLQEYVREQHGICKTIAYEAIQIYWCVVITGLSAENVRQLGVKKLGILCIQAMKAPWTNAQFSEHAEKAKAISYRKLADSFKVADGTAAPKLAKPPAPEPAAKPQSATMALLKSVQSAADVDAPAAEEEADELSAEPAPVLEFTDAQWVAHARACKLYRVMKLLEEAFPGINMTIDEDSVAPELLGEEEAAE